MIDLKHHIKTELEKGCGWDIDNKTMKRITSLLKEQGLINSYEFEVKYIANQDSESEEFVEYYSDSEDDPTFKIKQADSKGKRRSSKAKEKADAQLESTHSKIILAKPGIDDNDERIRNDPSITNPSLRQDKELPSSILQRVIESKQKQEEGKWQ